MSVLRALVDASGGRALVMGILNRTPDSFFDGGAFSSEDEADRRAAEMLAAGADLIDMGAESTRPGADPVPSAEQIRRLGSAVVRATKRGAIVSIDTTSPEVAAFALDQGALAINCVDPAMAAPLGALAAARGAALIVMHCRGSMRDMPGFSATPDSAYGDVARDVANELARAAGEALAAGLPRRDLFLDPGLGFAKSAAHSLALVARLREIGRLGYPLVVGPSRKSFLARAVADEERRAGRDLSPAPPGARLGASIAVALLCAESGASIVRVHDVHETRQALMAWSALRRIRSAGEGVSLAL